MRNYIFIVAMGFLVPVGIIIAGNTDSRPAFWLAIVLSIIGVLGVIFGLFRQNAQYKAGTKDGKSKQ
jgi:predicted MFS family arabinose efflux permease